SFQKEIRRYGNLSLEKSFFIQHISQFLIEKGESFFIHADQTRLKLIPGRVALILLHILLIISRAVSGLVDLFQVFPVSLFLIWHYRWGGRHFPDFFHTGDVL